MLGIGVTFALYWYTNHKETVDDAILDRSVYVEHRLGLGSGTQDCRRPVGGESSFKIYRFFGGKAFPEAEKPEFLTTVNSEEAQKHLVAFFHGGSRESEGRLGAVLSTHLSRDRYGFQAQKDVIELQDDIEQEAVRKNDWGFLARLSNMYQHYRDVMDPNLDEDFQKGIDAVNKIVEKYNAGWAFTGAPGGVMMIWLPNADDRDAMIKDLMALKEDKSLIYATGSEKRKGKHIFERAEVLDPVFTTEGYKISINRQKSLKEIIPKRELVRGGV